jgi:hypothetical protein
MISVVQSGPVLCSPVNHCWPSPAQSFLVLAPVGTHGQIFGSLLSPLALAIQHQHGLHRKRDFHGSSVIVCLFVCWRRNMFAAPLHSSDCPFCVPLFWLSAVMLLYIWVKKGQWICHGKLPACYLLLAGFLLGLFFEPEDGGNMFSRNVGWLQTDDIGLYPRR